MTDEEAADAGGEEGAKKVRLKRTIFRDINRHAAVVLDGRLLGTTAGGRCSSGITVLAGCWALW